MKNTWFCSASQFQDTLDDCAAGYFCEEGATNVVDGVTCDSGYFCPSGMTAYSDNEKCPVGTYGKKSGLQSSSQVPLIFFHIYSI